GDEPVFILIDVDAADLLDGLLHGRHCSLHCGFKGRGSDCPGYGRSSCASNLAAAQAATPCDPLCRVSYTFFHASRPRSTSVSVVAYPILTRIAAFASSGPYPIAASTWDGCTLP